MEKYFINWSVHTGDYLIKRRPDGKIVQICSKKEKAEKFCDELNEKENGKSTKGKW